MKPMSITLRVLIGALLSFLVVQPAGATGVEEVVIALHVQAQAQKTGFICTSASPSNQVPPLSCAEYNTQGSLLMPLDVYVVVARVDTIGISGVTFGIDYEGAAIGTGLDIVEWTLCASGLEFQSDGWPGPTTGNIVTWLKPEGCATQLIGNDAVHGVVGAFSVYAYGKDTLWIRDHPLIESRERLAASDCTGAVAFLEPTSGILGWAGFGTDPGCNPCLIPCIVPVRPTTWGAIKTKYRTF